MIRIKFEFLHFNFYLRKIIKLQMKLDITTGAYLIIVIFFTLTQFLENKIYTGKRQFSR